MEKLSKNVRITGFSGNNLEYVTMQLNRFLNGLDNLLWYSVEWVRPAVAPAHGTSKSSLSIVEYGVAVTYEVSRVVED